MSRENEIKEIAFLERRYKQSSDIKEKATIEKEIMGLMSNFSFESPEDIIRFDEELQAAMKS